MAQGTLYSFTYGNDSLILWCNEQGKYCPSAENEGKVEEWYGGPTDFNEVYSALSKHRAAHFGNALGAFGKAIAENFPQVLYNNDGSPK